MLYFNLITFLKEWFKKFYEFLSLATICYDKFVKTQWWLKKSKKYLKYYKKTSQKHCDNILTISPILHPLWNLKFLFIKHQISSDSFYFMSGSTAHWTQNLSSPMTCFRYTEFSVHEILKIWTDNWKKVAWVRLAAFLLTAIHYPATINLEIRLFHYHQMLHNFLKFRFRVPRSCTFL